MDNNTSTPPSEPQDRQPARLDRWSPVTEAMRHEHPTRTTARGNPIDPPDPGSRATRVFTILAAFFVVAAVVVWQNTPEETRQRLLLGRVQEAVPLAPDAPAPGGFGQVDLAARIFLRGYEMFKNYPVMDEFDPAGSGSKGGSSGSDSLSSETDVPPSHAHFIDEDRVRLIILAAEFKGEQQALRRIEELRTDLTTPPEDVDDVGESLGDVFEISADDQLILDELDALETLYTQGADALNPAQAQQLKDRYGYVGHVALTHGLPASHPDRQALLRGFIPLMLFLIVVGLVIVLGPLLGLVALILGIVNFLSGRLRMRARVPAPGGSVFLETYVLFVAGFLVMAVASFFVTYSTNPTIAGLAGLQLIVQWMLLLTVFWALLRGMRGRDWRHAIGWNRGAGVFKEIGWGIVGYLAAVPVFIAGVIITVIVLLIEQAIKTSMAGGVPPAPEPMTNPVFELLARADLLTVLLFFVLATTWAPIVEESIFRGALHRHLRARLHWVAVGIISALLFAYMHDYGPLMVAPLIALGFMFSFLREWRGSLIAPMTAHFIHNFMLVAMMIVFVQLIGDP